MAVEFRSVRLSKALSVLIDDFKVCCKDSCVDLSTELSASAFSIQHFLNKVSICYFQDRSLLSPSDDKKVRSILNFGPYTYLQTCVEDAYNKRNSLFE